MEQFNALEGDKKHIVIEERKVLLVYNEETYDTLILTDKTEKFILFEVSEGFPKDTCIIHYLVQKEKMQDINLN